MSSLPCATNVTLTTSSLTLPCWNIPSVPEAVHNHDHPSRQHAPEMSSAEQNTLTTPSEDPLKATAEDAKENMDSAPRRRLTLNSTPDNPHINVDLDPSIEREPGSADPTSPVAGSVLRTSLVSPYGDLCIDILLTTECRRSDQPTSTLQQASTQEGQRSR